MIYDILYIIYYILYYLIIIFIDMNILFIMIVYRVHNTDIGNSCNLRTRRRDRKSESVPQHGRLSTN